MYRSRHATESPSLPRPAWEFGDVVHNGTWGETAKIPRFGLGTEQQEKARAALPQESFIAFGCRVSAVFRRMPYEVTLGILHTPCPTPSYGEGLRESRQPPPPEGLASTNRWTEPLDGWGRLGCADRYTPVRGGAGDAKRGGA